MPVFSDPCTFTCRRTIWILTYSFWNIYFLENLALVDTGPGEASREAEKPAKEKMRRMIP